jgi:hypothetical protein
MAYHTPICTYTYRAFKYRVIRSDLYIFENLFKILKLPIPMKVLGLKE